MGRSMLTWDFGNFPVLAEPRHAIARWQFFLASFIDLH